MADVLDGRPPVRVSPDRRIAARRREEHHVVAHPVDDGLRGTGGILQAEFEAALGAPVHGGTIRLSHSRPMSTRPGFDRPTDAHPPIEE